MEAVQGRGGEVVERARDARTRTSRATRLLLLLLLAASGCAATRPARTDDACAIFAEKPDWLEETRDSYRKWGVPVPLQLAVIHQESDFVSDVRPPRGTFLWVFPGARPTSAYGYGQVLDATWDEYQEKSGGAFADRDDFGDVADFIGWYGTIGERRFGIPKTDPYAFYLSYHEGHTGYLRGSYKKKRQIQAIATSVAQRARRYARQLAACGEDAQEPARGSTKSSGSWR